jgi:hypothetical protein
MLLDPLIENSCGPIINCDFCSTFHEASPFLAFHLLLFSMVSTNWPFHQTQHLYSLATFELKGWNIYILFVLRNINQLLGLVLISSHHKHAHMQCNQTF